MPSRRARSVLPAAMVAGVLLLAGCTATATDAATDPAPTVPPLAVDGAAPGPGATPADVPPSAAPATSCVERTVAALGDRRFAQLVVAGVPAAGAGAASRSALARGVGGIILTDGDTASRPTVTATVRAAQRAAAQDGGVPLLVTADQEGGQVQELEGPGFTRLPSALAQGRDADGLRADAAGWGRELAAAGVNTDLAPVADVVDPDLGKANAPVGKFDRQYGSDPASAAAGVRAFVSGLDDGGVASTLKHFPGLGKVRENTDFAGGVVDRTTTADDPDLASFRAGIAAGAPLVMMSSARYTRIDPDNQALFSRAVMRDLLRDRLGFRGVVMTDDVGAAAALADTPVPERATRFLAAGGDLVLTIEPTDVAEMVPAIRARATRDPGFAARVDDAVRRVLALKADRGLLRC